MRTRRTAVALCAVSALAAVIYLIFKYESPVYIAPTVGAISLVSSILVLVYNYWSKGHASDPGETPAPEQIAAAADWLSGAVAGSWRKEAAARRIVTPTPVSVRWRWAGDLSPWEAGKLPVPGAGPRALPGSGLPDCLLTSGVVTELHDELYTRLPRGRLVITGGPGSGKTGAMILLLLEALARREELASDIRAQVPVPVLLPLGGWDPTSVSLSAWAASVLNRDYRALRAARYGDDAATTLISSGGVALFLDGLDEMPENLRVVALEQLNTDVPGLRIVMTSRSVEYAEAIGRTPLGGLAVIELCPVQPRVAAEFLLNEQPEDKRAKWQKVADHITANPGSPAAKALDNPLKLTMARDAYATDDPTVIIDSSLFPSEDAITTQLTGQFLTRAYPDQRVRHWLGYLARQMEGRGGNGLHDLEWWRLGGMLNLPTRILAITLATAVVGAFGGLIIEVPTTLISLALPGCLKFALSQFLMAGLVIGVTFGLAYTIMTSYGTGTFEQSQIPLRLLSPRAMVRALRRRNNAVQFASGFLGGLAGGIAFAIVVLLGEKLSFGVHILSSEEIREALVFMAFFSVLFGLAAGIAFFFVSALEEPSDTGTAATPLSLLAESRSRALLQAGILAPLTAIVIFAGGWIAADPLRGLLVLGPLDWTLPDALSVGGVAGIGGTISYILAFTAWGQWVVLSRIMLPLTGRLPWRLPAFLDDAYRRGVLRQAGGVYQFRHLTIQAYLSREEAAGDG